MSYLLKAICERGLIYSIALTDEKGCT